MYIHTSNIKWKEERERVFRGGNREAQGREQSPTGDRYTREEREIASLQKKKKKKKYIYILLYLLSIVCIASANTRYLVLLCTKISLSLSSIVFLFFIFFNRKYFLFFFLNCVEEIFVNFFVQRKTKNIHLRHSLFGVIFKDSENPCRSLDRTEHVNIYLSKLNVVYYIFDIFLF